MAFIETWEKQQEEEEKKKIPAEVNKPMVREILMSDEESPLFVEYLEAQNDLALAHKLAAGEIEKEDADVLREKRKDFLEIRNRTRVFKEKMTLSDIERMVAASPALKEGEELVGTGGLHEIFSRSLDKMALTDEARFALLEDRAKSLRKVDEVIKSGNEEIKKICKEQGFTEDEYMKALQGDASLDLDGLIRQKMGIFKRIFTSKGAIEAKAKAIDKREEIKDMLAQLRKERGELGGVLQSSLFENKTLKEALGNVLGGKEIPKDATFSEMVKLSTEPIDEVKIEKQYEQWYKKHEKDPDFDVGEAPQRFSEEYASTKKPKKKGLWARIFGEIFPKRVRNALD